MDQQPQTSTPSTSRSWPTGVAGVIAFAFGMIVTKIESPGWEIFFALAGGALSYGLAILVVRVMGK